MFNFKIIGLFHFFHASWSWCRGYVYSILFVKLINLSFHRHWQLGCYMISYCFLQSIKDFITRVSCQKGPYLPYISLAGRALLAGYHRIKNFVSRTSPNLLACYWCSVIYIYWSNIDTIKVVWLLFSNYKIKLMIWIQMISNQCLSSWKYVIKGFYLII